jgi:ABC-2 type transport system permease protein
MLFSLAGFLNGLFAKKFDDVMLIPTFVLTPLTYLGGVFYSIHMLPVFWQKISLLNPILYLVNAFRFGILGVSDIGIGYALGILVVLNVLLYALCWYLLKIGYGIRS